MRCERCGGLKVGDHFYSTAIDVSAWMYDGLRCINCGSITVPIRGEREVNDAPGTERSSRLGQIYSEIFSSERTTPGELLVRMDRGEKTEANLTWRLNCNQTLSSTVAEDCIAMMSQ